MSTEEEDKFNKVDNEDPTTFDKFYPVFLGFHSRPVTKMMHFIGFLIILSSLAVYSYLLIAEVKDPMHWLPLVGLISGLSFAEGSHQCFEKKKGPPMSMFLVWSTIAYFKMNFEIMACRHKIMPF